MCRISPIGMLLVGSLVAAACRGSSPGGSGGDPGSGTEPAPTASLTAVDPSGASGPFAISGLERLLISVDGAGLRPGPHTVRVDVTSPRGTLYAQLRSTLVANEERQGRATRSLQVRGTIITSYRETGTWQLVANVDGVPLAAASVDLTE